MKNIFKVALGTLALTAATASAAPQYPFPQNMAHPNGITAKYADPSVIKSHFDIWKKAWYQDKGSEAWILAPEGTCSTVSEGIAYGMLIMVYMSSTSDDHQAEFDKLWATWKNNSVSGGASGMNWRVGCSASNGSASDADFDAALALVMASKQWNNTQYLNEAKSLISWIGSNDIESNGSVKAGSNWNPMFNPSYGTLANFELFAKVSGDSKWKTVITKTEQDLLLCQNSTTGLVTDWCDWSSHQPANNSQAAVGQADNPGFFDDAARTPWRMAWSYYWYGNANAKKFNDKIAKWMYTMSNGTASGINSGYYPNGSISPKREEFVSSTFSGGMGLAAASDVTGGEGFMQSLYKTLSAMTSCATANGCGESVKGEKYYPATLNLLYMLLMTGNMPNLYDMAGFTKFTPDASLLPSADSGIEGVQQKPKDQTVGVSGFWNWGAYHDKLGIGTKMTPDSGASPVYLRNGAYYADANMEIGPEPEWTPEAAAAGTLKYPSAGIAMSFLENDKKGVDLSALGVKYLRITAKSEGPIRFAILNEATAEAGAEPGMYISASSDYKATTYDLTPCDWGFLGLAANCNVASETNSIGILSWVNTSKAPSGVEIIKVVTGLKFEVKDSKGGFGAISVKSIEFLDANKQVIDPAKITGVVISSNPPQGGDQGGDQGGQQGGDQQAIVSAAQLSMAKISVSGMNITVTGAKAGSDIAVFNMQGKLVASSKALGAQSITVPNKGIYMVRVGNKMSKVAVK